MRIADITVQSLMAINGYQISHKEAGYLLDLYLQSGKVDTDEFTELDSATMLAEAIYYADDKAFRL